MIYYWGTVPINISYLKNTLNLIAYNKSQFINSLFCVLATRAGFSLRVLMTLGMLTHVFAMCVCWLAGCRLWFWPDVLIIHQASLGTSHSGGLRVPRSNKRAWPIVQVLV